MNKGSCPLHMSVDSDMSLSAAVAKRQLDENSSQFENGPQREAKKSLVLGNVALKY